MSRLCLGTMTFGEQNSESEAHQQLSLCGRGERGAHLVGQQAMGFEQAPDNWRHRQPLEARQTLTQKLLVLLRESCLRLVERRDLFP